MFGLTPKEYAFLKKLSTPQKIQDYLDTLPINFEKTGETLMSPRRVLRERRAHCMEGALSQLQPSGLRARNLYSLT